VNNLINGIDVTDKLYEYDTGGANNILTLQHVSAIGLAITANVNPTADEILLIVDTVTGITINTNGYVRDNLEIGGNLIVGTTNIITTINTLQTNVNNADANITTLQNKVIYEIKEIHAMQSDMTIGKIAEFPPGIFLLYSDLNAPNIYTKTDTDNLLNTKQGTLTSNSSVEIGTLTITDKIHSRQGVGLDIAALSTAVDQSLSIITNSESRDAILYLGTPQFASDPAKKCALIAEGLSFYSKNKFHICVNNESVNGLSGTASLADSRLSVDGDGLVNIPGSLSTNSITTSNYYSSADHRFFDTNGSTRLTMASSRNTFLNQCLMPELIVEASSNARTTIRATDSSGGVASHFLSANGAVAQHFMSFTKHQITTNTTNGIIIRANRFSSSVIALEIDTANSTTFGGTAFFADGSSNASDSRLKSTPVDASIQDSLNMLKTVSARTYERIDKPGTGVRVGFIAQEVQASLPVEFANLIGKVKYSADPDEENPMEILTVDYARLVAPLWQCCKNLLARVEALEAKINSP
jgi:hypothetical protein